MFSEISRGEQSIVGFVKYPNQDAIFIKISRDIDFAVIHEHTVSERLYSIEELRENFLKPEKILTLWTKNTIRIECESDILTSPENGSIPRQAYELQYLKDALTLDEYISKNKASIESEIFPIMQYVMVIIRIAQETINFTHYDLHTDNILVQPNSLEKGRERIFKFKDGSQRSIKWTKMIPVIIDYGRSYCDALIGSPINVELFNTHYGLFSTMSHPTFDYIFFLNSCANSLKCRVKATAFYKKFKPYTRHLTEDGWWNVKENSALEEAMCLVRASSCQSIIFSNYLPLSLVLFSHLCMIPIKRTDFKNSQIFVYYFDKFIVEWKKIEKWFCVEKKDRLLYFFSFFVSLMSTQKNVYYDSATRKSSQTEIVHQLCEYLNSEFNSVWDADEIKWGELIRCGYLTGRTLEGVIAEKIENQTGRFDKCIGMYTFDELFALI